MKSRRASRRMLMAVTLVLALGFMVAGANQAAAKVVVRAKVGPVYVKVGGNNYRHHGPRVVYTRPYRPARACGTTVVVEPRPYRTEAVWVPGHWKVKWNGRRKWVPGHWALI